MNQLTLSFLDPPEPIRPVGDGDSEERGGVFTRRVVVDFILDLVGYTTERPLPEFRLIEPACGEGGFLIPVVERLLTAYRIQARDRAGIVRSLSHAIRAFEVHGDSLERTRAKLLAVFQEHEISRKDAAQLLSRWLVEGDFLLVDLPHAFTHAVGNPPYVRQELIPDSLLAQYRSRYRTIYDRADLYVPFIERCLNHLQPGGVLGFICADRWMKNRYGAPLRALVAGQYHLACYVDMVDTPAFDAEVSAYPAITLIKREPPGPTRIAHRPRLERDALEKLARVMRADPVPDGCGIVEVARVARGREPWILQSFDQLAIARRLEADFPPLEAAGCKVGIGVATGADKVFIGPFDRLDVEPDRKLPLVKTQDIEGGTVNWQGLGVINPFGDDGALVDLVDYPRLACYVERHAEVIRQRNCAQRNPKAWYRTIDRIDARLTNRPKLLIPDIKGDAHVVYESGQFYPHHNLYFMTSDEWDLLALQAVLRSGIAKLFVSIYSTRMRGGYWRFQAQYLRRIRLPRWRDVPETIRQTLMDAARAGDIETGSRTVFDLYQLTTTERAVIGGLAWGNS